MKSLILKNKKLVSIGLVALAILFMILIISNLTSTEREAYQTMYDANAELYSTYTDYADKFAGYGYSSKSQELYSKAGSLNEKLDRYSDELSSLNIQVGIYVVLMIGSIIGAVLVFKMKDNADNLVETINESNNPGSDDE